MSITPTSKQFDDVYFSEEDGLAESRYVFLNGNLLPDVWRNRSEDRGAFTIFETGFGTGLNFLAAWQLFDETAGSGQSLEFISVEKYPLNADEIRTYLSPWSDKFGERFDLFLERYPDIKNGAARYDIDLDEHVRLTLHIGDANVTLPTLDNENIKVDAWFLDGFKPATNPDMWSNTVFDAMDKMTVRGGSFATFTAAGFVRRATEAAGFEVKKITGFGRKREMLVGLKL